MYRRINHKWRPPLLLILGGALSVVLTAPIAGYFALHLLGEMLGTRQALIVIGVAIFMLTLVLGYLLWRLILQPVTSLAERAEAIKNGDISARAPLAHYGTPELWELGQSVLDMADVLHNREATIRSYTDHVTHELKTPLTALIGAAELLSDAPAHLDEDQNLIATILEASTRMEHLLGAARKIAAARVPTHVGATTIEALIVGLKSRFPLMDFDVTGSEIVIPMHADGLEIIVHHLVENSAEHGASRISLRVATLDGGVQLLIQDDGQGISAGNRGRIFTPFFTTIRAQGGTGMGLSIVQSMIHAHQGKVFLQPGGSETTFVIQF